MIKAIAAVSENNVIGYQGQLPWECKEDLKFFRKTTIGKTVVMGRKTFESIGKPLEKRENIVISRKAENIDGVTVIRNPKEIFSWKKEIFVIGGGEIYNIFLPACKELIITRFHFSTAGDTFFPDIPKHFKLEVLTEGNKNITFVDKSIERWYI